MKSIPEAFDDTISKAYMWTYFAGIILGTLIQFETRVQLFGTMVIWFLGIFVVEIFYPSKKQK